MKRVKTTKNVFLRKDGLKHGAVCFGGFRVLSCFYDVMMLVMCIIVL